MSKTYSYFRFSAAVQAQGDSLRRQRDLAHDYCVRHNLTLDDRSYQDLGLSAFHGTHLASGALGLFLEAIKKGEVQPGDLLLVESLDRLSREEVFTALSTFQAIINAGVTIVTLNDNRTYNRENINDIGTLIMSLVIMSTAHQESYKKSQRLKAAWHNKRNNAATKIMTSQCPAWVRVVDGQFKLIPERAKIIKEIFRLSKNGQGKRMITKQFNIKQVLFFGRGNGWRETYISHILHSRTVLGEFNPHIKQKGKRIPTDIIIKDYYPRVIDDQDFAIVQAKMKQRLHGGGRPSKQEQNIFTGLLHCGYCGGTMRREQKETLALRCDKAYRALNCQHHYRYPYPMVESTLIFHIKSLDLESMLFNKKGDDKDDRLVHKVKMNGLKARRDHLVEAIEVGGDIRALVLRLQEIEREIFAAEQSIPAPAPVVDDDEIDPMELIDELIDRMEQVEFRLYLRDRIRTIVSSIQMFENYMEVRYVGTDVVDKIDYCE